MSEWKLIHVQEKRCRAIELFDRVLSYVTFQNITEIRNILFNSSIKVLYNIERIVYWVFSFNYKTDQSIS